ncbi:MAG: hypothetical protein RIB59_06285, partial [Rhodospirillales bacterium]
ETIEAPLPAVVTIAHELGKPRYTSLRETMKAARKPTQVWKADDLGLDAGVIGAAGARRVWESVYIPVEERRCEFLDGGSPLEMAATLAQ